MQEHDTDHEIATEYVSEHLELPLGDLRVVSQGDLHNDLQACENDDSHPIVNKGLTYLLKQPRGDFDDDFESSDNDDNGSSSSENLSRTERLASNSPARDVNQNWSLRESLNYSPMDAPLLFDQGSRRQRRGCCQCRCGSASRASSKGSSSREHIDPLEFLGVDIKYDMWVMPVMRLMELDAMEPHQVLIAKGLVLRWRPSMEGRIIFISHQWLGLSSPDPDSVHLQTLQRVLERLMNGEIPEVRTHYKSGEFSDALSIKAEDWVAALPHMYIWLDYFSMPQVSVTAPRQVFLGGLGQGKPKSSLQSSSSDRMLNGSLSVAYAITWAESMGCPPGVSDLPLKHSFKDGIDEGSSATLDQSDHRYRKSRVAMDLQNAVSSIPAYVQLSSLIIVLAPMCRHHDTSYAADYSSWRTRGWCRMELASACLSPHHLPMMLVLGAEHTPVFLRTFDALQLPPGEGHFSCCALNHIVGNTKIPCDKERVLEVMETLISCKVAQLEQDGDCVSKAMFASLRGHFLRGLHVAAKQSTAVSTLSSLKELHGSAVASGSRFLLQLALQCDSIERVREVLDTYEIDLNSFGLEERSLGIFELPLLAIAMSFSSADVVRELLDRRADATKKVRKGNAISRGMDSFQMAIIVGREDNVRAWLDLFPDWIANKVANNQDYLGLLGVRFMGFAALGFNLSSDASMIRCLIDARAGVNDRSYLGGTPLFMACNSMRSTEVCVKELIAQGADIHAEAFPQTKILKLITWLCRNTCKAGDPEGIKVYFAMMHGATPLHLAALNAKFANVEILVEARADVSRRNTMGLTPLDVAAWMYKEVPQPLLELLS